MCVTQGVLRLGTAASSSLLNTLGGRQWRGLAAPTALQKQPHSRGGGVCGVSCVNGHTVTSGRRQCYVLAAPTTLHNKQ